MFSIRFFKSEPIADGPGDKVTPIECDFRVSSWFGRAEIQEVCQHDFGVASRLGFTEPVRRSGTGEFRIIAFLSLDRQGMTTRSGDTVAGFLKFKP